jgi:hypothetical protein
MNQIDQRLRDADPLAGRLPDPLASPFAADGEAHSVLYGSPGRRRGRAWGAALVASAAAVAAMVLVVGGVGGGGTPDRRAVPASLSSPVAAVEAEIAAWNRGDLDEVCATYSATKLAQTTDHGRSDCGKVLAAGGPEVERDRRRFSNATAVELLRTPHLAAVRVRAPGAQAFDVTVLREGGQWRVGAYCEPACSEHRLPPVKNSDVTVNTTAIEPAATETTAPPGHGAPRNPVAAVPDDLPVQALRGSGAGDIPEDLRSALAGSDSNGTMNSELARLLVDDGKAAIAAAPTRTGLCIASRAAGDHGVGIHCDSAESVAQGGAYEFNPCWHGDATAVNVMGVAPDGVTSVALLRSGRVVESAPVVNNAFHIAGRNIDGLRIGDQDTELDTQGIC